MIVGKESDFAIEITDYDKVKRIAKLKLHLNGKVFGDGKKSKSIDPLVSALETIIEAGDSLYDTSFNNRSFGDVFSTVLVLHAEVGEWTDDDYAQLDRYERFTFFWGEQFSNVTAVVFTKDGICHILWSMNKNMSGGKIDYLKNLHADLIPLNSIVGVKDELMQYLNQ
ncbi:hypothetical protein [Chitinophaga ginsengisoli]|uniref:Uncharacterized protein n=1 Tax=Chitinophaga ginsengisoli TaxID=363837 RepID=A0A2P8F7V3_9BACT|nr:hypothetical protein [Chitinophaga ginsengisoli]PSL17787.1 hypothetical protein CLV42_1412 [Chitinophaga ginsengisoli]